MRGCDIPKMEHGRKPGRESRGCGPAPMPRKRPHKPTPLGLALRVFRAFAG